MAEPHRDIGYSSPSFEGVKAAFLVGGVLAGWVCLALAARAQAQGGLAPAVAEVVLERGCFGCASGSLLRLRRDGTVTFTETGSARHGTLDRISRGRVSEQDFAALAQRLVARGFFEFEESYEDPQLRDGAWAVTTVERGGVVTRVFNRESAGPERLREIQSDIEDLKGRTRTLSGGGP